jgi:hypothetical protein
LPAPVNVALAGAPNTDGCCEGALLHESLVEQTGGDANGVTHGETLVHSCASYTSAEVSLSSSESFAVVRKNTSWPLLLTSRNADSSPELPEEINPTQPPDPGLNPGAELVQLPTPTGSYSYTSCVPLTSCGTSASLLLKNTRPLSGR